MINISRGEEEEESEEERRGEETGSEEALRRSESEEGRGKGCSRGEKDWSAVQLGNDI